MLRLRFFNVGDGDCILIEDGEFRMLVDTGKAEVPESAPAATCAEHLSRAGVRHLDRLVITHLHTDHFGGLAALMQQTAIGEIISGYFPLEPGRAAVDPRMTKTERGLASCLNEWSEDVERLKRTGCRTTELFASWHDVRLTPRLSADLIVPDVRALRLQRNVCNRMLRCEPVPSSQVVRAAKLRNPNSLRIRLYYAGRTIELAADCYGSLWDDAAEPCDILKAPHHGDVKSVTDALVMKLRPAHAVISCGRDYLPAKDRPSARTIACLRDAGADVWFTDCFSDGTSELHIWPSVDFTILDDGRILPPL